MRAAPRSPMLLVQANFEGMSEMTTTGMHERLETKMESTFGSGDLRMLYGMGVPFLVMTGLIIAALVLETMWLNHMLDDEDGPASRSSARW